MLKYALLLLVGTLWGSQYIFIKTALEDLDPLDISFLRTALAAGIMAVACFMFQRSMKQPTHLARRAFPMVADRDHRNHGNGVAGPLIAYDRRR